MSRAPLRTDLAGRVPERPMLVGLAQAARLLALSPRTVRRLAAEGALGYVRVGRALRFEVVELEAFVARHRVGGR